MVVPFPSHWAPSACTRVWALHECGHPACTSELHPHPQPTDWAAFKGMPTKKTPQALEWAQSSLDGEFLGSRFPEHGQGEQRLQRALPEGSWVLQPVRRGSNRLGQSRPSEAPGLGQRPLPRFKGHHAKVKRQGPIHRWLRNNISQASGPSLDYKISLVGCE